MPSFDLSTYFGVFIGEIDEQIQLITTELIILEKDPNHFLSFKKICRALFNIQRVSLAMGVDAFKTLTKRLMALLDLQPDEDPTCFLPLLKEGILAINLLKEDVLKGKCEPLNLSLFLEKLEGHIKRREEINPLDPIENQISLLNFTRTADESSQKKRRASPKEQFRKLLNIEVELEPDTLLKSVRALLIHHNLKEAGKILDVHPSLDYIEQEDTFEGSFKVTLLTQQTDYELLNLINQVSDIKHFHITQNNEALFSGMKLLTHHSESQEEQIEPVSMNGYDKMERDFPALKNSQPENQLDQAFAFYQTTLFDQREQLLSKSDMHETVEALNVLIFHFNHLYQVYIKEKDEENQALNS